MACRFLNQGTDIAVAINAEVVKSLPSGFARPLSLASVAEQVEKKKQEKENPPPKAAPQVLVVEEPPAPQPEEEEAEEEAEALQHAGASTFTAFSSIMSGVGKGKHRGKGRPKAAAKEKAPPSTPPPKRCRRGSDSRNAATASFAASHPPSEAAGAV